MAFIDILLSGWKCLIMNCKTVTDKEHEASPSSSSIGCLNWDGALIAGESQVEGEER